MGIIDRLRGKGRPAQAAKDRSWEGKAIRKQQKREANAGRLKRFAGAAGRGAGRVAAGTARLAGGGIRYVGSTYKTAAKMRVRKEIRRSLGVSKRPKMRGGYGRQPQVVVIDGGTARRQQVPPQFKKKRQAQEGRGGWGQGWSGFQ